MTQLAVFFFFFAYLSIYSFIDSLSINSQWEKPNYIDHKYGSPKYRKPGWGVLFGILCVGGGGGGSPRLTKTITVPPPPPPPPAAGFSKSWRVPPGSPNPRPISSDHVIFHNFLQTWVLKIVLGLRTHSLVQMKWTFNTCRTFFWMVVGEVNQY